MGRPKRLSAEPAGHAAPAADDRLTPLPASRTGPIHGFVMRHGQTIPFTLDTSQPLAAAPSIMPEQIAMGGLVLASFIGAIYRLMV